MLVDCRYREFYTGWRWCQRCKPGSVDAARKVGSHKELHIGHGYLLQLHNEIWQVSSVSFWEPHFVGGFQIKLSPVFSYLKESGKQGSTGVRWTMLVNSPCFFTLQVQDEVFVTTLSEVMARWSLGSRIILSCECDVSDLKNRYMHY